MSLSSLVGAGRAAAERMMVDACTITRATGLSDPDPVTGAVDVVADEIYSGACQVSTYEAHEQVVAMPGQVMTRERYVVKVPVGTGPFAVGDIVTMTAATFDAQLVGREYSVVAMLHKSVATAQRLQVEEVVAP